MEFERDKTICMMCGWRGRESEILSAPNPFEPGGKIWGCPKCKRIEQFRPVCAHKDCWNGLQTWVKVQGEYIGFCEKHAQEIESKRKKEGRRSNDI